MHYIYMHNYRGFQDTLVPMSQVNFFVGENSTGKTSCLILLRLLSDTAFWITPEHEILEDTGFRSFSDIVTANSPNGSRFRVGSIRLNNIEADSDTKAAGPNKPSLHSLQYTVVEFAKGRDGLPRVARYVHQSPTTRTDLQYSSRRLRYKTAVKSIPHSTAEEALREFRKEMDQELDDGSGYKSKTRAAGGSAFFHTIPPSAMAAISHREFGIESPTGPIAMTTLNLGEASWIAPIRSKPKRIYDAFTSRYSPEGDHAPFTLRAKSRKASFVQKLKAFGEASGLFEAATAHSFGKQRQAPFEVLITLASRKLNISNVGYGVSQSLPLVIDILSAGEQSTFAIQQPEVHLHPRAQSALGDLLADSASAMDHSFFIETHSDFLIDRFRMNMARQDSPPATQALFFYRSAAGNAFHSLPIGPDGSYPEDQPEQFRSFFIREAMDLIGL